VKVLLTTISDNVDASNVVVDTEEAKTFGRLAQHRFKDGYMSKVHFRVMNTGDRASVQNLSETNPVLLNGKKILDRADLCDGDKLQAGRTIFSVELRALPSSPTPPPIVPRPVSPPKPKPIQNQREREQQKAWPPNETEPVIPAPSGTLEIPVPTRPPTAENRTDDESASKPNRRSPIVWELESDPQKAQFPEQVQPSWVEQIPKDFPNIPQRAQPPQSPDDATGHYCMEFVTSEEASDGYATLLESMSRRWCVELVLHFQKIRQPPPELADIHQLFTWLTINDKRPYSAPFVVSHLNLKLESNVMQFLPRLCRSDACIAFVGNSSDKILQQIDNMINEGVEGFSEQGGFLPCCWPSSFATIIDCAGRSVCKSLFGDGIVGAYFCAAGNRKKLVGVGNAEFAAYLKKNKFRETQRIIT